MAKRLDELSMEELQERIDNAAKMGKEYEVLARNRREDFQMYKKEREHRIKLKKASQVIVSDHAVLRFLERFLEVDVDEIHSGLAKEALPAVQAARS